MFNGRLNAVQLLVCLAVSLASFCYGYSVNITSSTLGQPSFQEYMKLDGSPYATTITSAIGVGAFAGAAVGCLFVPFGADRFGRKFNLYVFGSLLVVAGAIQAGSINSGMFVASRVLVGIACGALFTSVPIYQSEVAPAHLRGAMIACHGTLFCLGSFTAQWMSVGFFFTGGALAWRAPLAIQVVFPLALVAILRWVPESPRFLISKGRHEEARAILTQLHTIPGHHSEEAVEMEYQGIHHAVESEGVWTDLFATAANRKRTMLACFMAMFYAFTGINVIAGYSSILLGNLGMKPFEQIVLFAGVVTTAPLGNFFAGFFVDRLGRIKMILIGLVTCIVALVIQSVVVLRGNGNVVASSFGVLSFFLFFIGFCTFYDVPCWAYTSEIWPQTLRAKGFSLALFFYFVGNIITVGAAPTAFASMGGYFFLLFIGAMVLACPFFYFYFPETSNLSLEDMGDLFGDAKLGVEEPVVQLVEQHGADENGKDSKLPSSKFV